MSKDDVLQSVRSAREAYCQRFGYDLGAIVRDLRERERSGGRRVVRLSPRRPVQAVRKPVENPA
jgi:hypothetical protein